MADRRVAKRYARALFNVALKLYVLDSVEDDLEAIVGLMKKDERFETFLLSPRIGRDDKVHMIYKLFSDRVTAVTLQAMRLLLEKRREAEIEGVRDEYAILRREYGQVLYATISSAEPLSDEDSNRLLAKLKEKSGKKVEAVFEVDASLIGGVRVAYGNYVLDGSVKGSLRRLRDALRY